MTIEGIPETMLAAQVVEYNKPYKIHQVPTPRTIGPHDLLLKTKVVSLCHTDGMVRAGIIRRKLPCIASHEGTGVVAAIGPEVTEFKKGDRVMGGLPRNRCGHCSNCLGDENYRHYCVNVSGYVGVSLDGAFAEYYVVDSRESCLIPDTLSFEIAAPLACAGRTIFRGMLQTELKSGETIGLIGAGGGLGHLGCQFAKALGLSVVGIDARDEGLALAKESGADLLIDARQGKEKVIEEVHGNAPSAMGVDATVNLSDNPGAAALACAITKMHGTMVQIAQPPEVSIPYDELIFRDIRVKGSFICAQSEARRMLQVVAEYGISVKSNIFFGLEEIPRLIDLVESKKMAGKGVIIIDKEEIKKAKDRDIASL